MQEFILSALAAVNAVFISLSQVALWQRKEYRLDRMRVYSMSPEGSITNHYALLASYVFLAVAWGAFLVGAMSIVSSVAMLSLLSVALGHIFRSVQKGVFRPDFTSRAIIVFVAASILCIIYIALFIPRTENISLYLATFVFFVPLLVALAVYGVGIPAQAKKQRLISRAQDYRNHLKNLTVVGVTGSVGKTSTKTYLIHLLGGESETVVATSQHRNSPYSVSQDMLSRLSQKTHIYIAEMGAYIRGEISELAQITKPTIGIVTAITNQHVGLFGSLEALARTKWELIESLPGDGVAVLNKDDAQIVKQAKYLQKKTVWFSAKEQADVFALDIVLSKESTTCTLSIGNEVRDIALPIISRGQLMPALAALAAAYALGVDSKLLVDRLKTLPILQRTMELRTGIHGATIVDDSYSASEASVTNAIEYLMAIESNDIRLVVVPIIELGTEGSAVHERIGKLLSGLRARVYIYGDAYKEDIMRGLQNDSTLQVTWYSDAKQLQEQITKDITSQTVILLEGRIPSLVRTSVL